MNLGIFGRIKVWMTRLQTYVSLLNFGLLFYVFIQSNDWLPWYLWLLLFVGGLSSLLAFDVRVIMPHGLSYTWEKNPHWHRLDKKLDRILEELK